MTIAEQTLKQHDIKLTRQRLAVTEVLQQMSERHVTAEQLYLRMQQLQYEVGLATVYRVLSDLESGGLLRRTQLLQGKTYYELRDGAPHLHLIDLQRGEIVELQNEPLLQQLQAAVKAQGYQIVDMQLNLYVKDDTNKSLG